MTRYRVKLRRRGTKTQPTPAPRSHVPLSVCDALPVEVREWVDRAHGDPALYGALLRAQPKTLHNAIITYDLWLFAIGR